MKYGKMELFLLVTFAPLCMCMVPGAPPPDDDDITESPSGFPQEGDCKMSGLMNAFSFGMQKSMSENNNDNTVFSPYSIYSALAMVSLGANDTTKEQITNALKWESGENYLATLKSMHEEFTSEGNNVDAKLNVANNGWVGLNTNLLDNYQNEMNNYFGVQFQKENFQNASNARDNINRWVSDHTGERIPELFPPGSFNAMTTLVLANAIYFKGEWKMPFNKNYTTPDEFTREDNTKITGVKYMFKNGEFLSGVHRNVDLLELPYGSDGKFTMLFAKPKHPSEVWKYKENSTNFINISRLSNEINEELLNEMLQSLTSHSTTSKIDIYVPRFTVKQGFDLIDKLESLGITDLFSQSNADLSGITGEKNLYVSSAQHKSFIAVDEEGTTAAGATGVSISVLSMPRAIRLNRPFLFFILNKPCNSIIFAGKVMEPPV